MAICKKRAAKKAEKRAAKAAARAERAQTRRGSFLGRCVRRMFVCTLVLGGVVAAVAYFGRPGTGDGEDA